MLSILITVFVSASLFAQKGEMKIVPTADPSIFKLYFSADISSDIKVNVRDKSRNSVFNRKIKDKKGFILPIDFSGFESDRYTIELFSPLFSLYDTVDYKSVGDRFVDNFEWEVIAEKNKVIVTAIKPFDDEITVLIRDDDNIEIDKQRIPGDRFGVRVFNFDGMNTDIIYLSLYYKGEVVISKEFEIK